MFVFVSRTTFRKEITKQTEIRSNDLQENVLYQWLHGDIQPNNIFSALARTKLDVR